MKIIAVSTTDDTFLVDMEREDQKGFVFSLSGNSRSTEMHVLSFFRFIDFNMLDSSEPIPEMDLEKIYQRPIKA